MADFRSGRSRGETPRRVRRLALVALYQLDARGGEDLEEIRATLDEMDRLGEDGPLFDASGGDERDLTPAQRQRAFDLAVEAYERRASADAEHDGLAPGWPARRQAALDRSILRLAHHEMTSGRTPPKVAADEAVELAKAFGGDKSPAFIAGLVGRVCERCLRGGPGSTPLGVAADVAGDTASGHGEGA